MFESMEPDKNNHWFYDKCIKFVCKTIKIQIWYSNWQNDTNIYDKRFRFDFRATVNDYQTVVDLLKSFHFIWIWMQIIHTM